MSAAFVPRDFYRISNLRSAAAIAADWLVIAAAIWAGEAAAAWAQEARALWAAAPDPAAAPLLLGLARADLAIAGLWGLQIAAYLLAVFVIAGRMMALVEVLGHDAAHDMLFTPRRLNRVLDFLYFVPFGDTYEGYRAHHMPHHGRLMSERDPSYADFRRWGLYDPRKGSVRVLILRPFLAYETVYDLASFFHAVATDPIRRVKILGFWIPAAIVISLSGGWGLFALYWLVPLLWIKPGLEFWSEVCDHFAVAGDQTRSSRGFAHWAFLNPHGDGYHAMHHRYPRIPCFHLRRAHEAYGRLIAPLPAQTFTQTIAEVWRARRALRTATPPATPPTAPPATPPASPSTPSPGLV